VQQQQEPVPLIGSSSLGDNFEFETFRSWQREKKLAGRKKEKWLKQKHLQFARRISALLGSKRL
jgi:hypothetical protein